MNCADCLSAGECLRRESNMSPNMMRGCQRSRAISLRWDKRFPVKDESVIPGPHSAIQSERPRSQPGTLILRSPKPRKRGLGDAIESALKTVGVTEERVSKWLGRPCGCRARRQKLNRLSEWASSVVAGLAGRKELDDIVVK